MRVKVEKKFKDKLTGDIRNIGMEFDCEESRAAELIKDGNYVCEVAQNTDKQQSEENMEVPEQPNMEAAGEMVSGYMDEEQLNEMDYAQLKHLAKELGALAKGNKKELIKQILQIEVQVAKGE